MTTGEYEIGEIITIDRDNVGFGVPAGIRGEIISGPIVLYPGTTQEDTCYAVHLTVADRLRLSLGGSIGNLLVPTRAILRGDKPRDSVPPI
jgi:hypothetical protein